MAIPKIASYQLGDVIQVENKVNWHVESSRAVLLVHDMQNYFINFYDQKQQPIPEVLTNIQRIMQWCRDQQIPIYFTAQPGDQDPQERALLTDFWGPGLKADPALTNIHPQVAPQEDDTVLTKWRYSAFVKSDFKQRLQGSGRDQLIVVGVYAHIGCMQTIMEAFMNDIKGFLISDAVADFSLDEHNMALKYVASRGGCVFTTSHLVTQKNINTAQEQNLEGVA